MADTAQQQADDSDVGNANAPSTVTVTRNEPGMGAVSHRAPGPLVAFPTSADMRKFAKGRPAFGPQSG